MKADMVLQVWALVTALAFVGVFWVGVIVVHWCWRQALRLWMKRAG